MGSEALEEAVVLKSVSVEALSLEVVSLKPASLKSLSLGAVSGWEAVSADALVSADAPVSNDAPETDVPVSGWETASFLGRGSGRGGSFTGMDGPCGACDQTSGAGGVVARGGGGRGALQGANPQL